MYISTFNRFVNTQQKKNLADLIANESSWDILFVS